MSVAPRKIAILAQIAPRRVGSFERSHFGTVRALEGRGWDVVSAFSGAISGPVRDRFPSGGDRRVEGLGDADTRASRDRWLALLGSERPDLVWMHFFPTMGVFAHRIRRALPGSRIVQTDHISRLPAARGPFREVGHRARLALTSGWLDAHIAVSNFVAERLAVADRVPRGRIRVIHNGVDLDAFRPSAGDPAGDYLMMAGFMRPEKGAGVLLDALALLKAAGSEPRCLLAGDGPGLPGFRAFAGEAGLGKVEFLGPRDDVPDLLRGAMAAIVPSTWPEAFSYAAAEAQALGVPVVASAIGGLLEVVEDGVTGLHVAPGDPEALAAAIGRLLRDPGLGRSLGLAGRERAARLFDLRARIAETVAFFDEIAPEGGS